MSEQEFVVQQFQKAFLNWREEPFVLYGLGKNTEAILQGAKGYQFAGLMDARNVGNKFWGLKVLSDQEVLELKPRVVIIARESIVPVIYQRIAYMQEKHDIPIYNFRGELLGQKERKYSNQNLPYWNIAEADLRNAIDSHEYISFDIFDTLIMRKVLEPTDVFDIVERLLEEKGFENNRFRERRVSAEEALKYPAIGQICEELGKRYYISEEILCQWMQLETMVESRVLVPRGKMIELYRYALDQGKKVFLISDMYFPEKEMERFLRKCGVEDWDGLFVSCDYGRGKSEGGLFAVYKQHVAGEKYLHIGDNRRSDGEMAREYGLDTFQIYSGYEMWMASAMQTTLAHVESLEQRCILGNLIWRCCENPFVLQKGKGVLAVDSPEKIGELFLGVLYDEFVGWLAGELAGKEIEQLLLPARDGFLIEQMLIQQGVQSFEYKYFKASRRAVSVAAIQSTEDILLLAERGFQGTYGELLQRRYGVNPRPGDALQNRKVKGAPVYDIREYVLSYQEEIFLQAEQERCNYLAYLRSLGLLNEKKQAIFDFVAGGTVQYFMQKLLNERLVGVYFATMNHPVVRYHLEEDIVSAYGNICSYGVENQVAKHYLFLETIMVDGYPTLNHVESDKFIYEKDENDSFSVVQKVQQGILRYQRDMMEIKELVPRWKDQRDFADQLFGMLFDGGCQVSEDIRQVFTNDDVFDGVETYQVWKG